MYQTIKVTNKEDDCRLDRFLRRTYPTLTQGLIQKLLRTRAIRVNGAKATADKRLVVGDEIRLPSIKAPVAKKTQSLSKKEADFIQSLVIYKDDDVIALNKPAGLAVQGGSKTTRHVDGLLDGLRFGAERPRLVHRLDKETSGVLVLARNVKAAGYLTNAFAKHSLNKIYWSLVAGVPKPKNGTINAPLLKGENGVRLDDKGQPATTDYETIDNFGKNVAWLALSPRTGRTHQLRVHMAKVLNVPILGDDKYGHLWDDRWDIPHRMYLHAYSLDMRLPSGKNVHLVAPLSDDMKKGFSFFGFDDKTI